MIQIFTDVETTGLISNEALPLAQQPRIIEIAAVKIDDVSGEILGTFESYVNPGERLSAEITQITGITDVALVGAPFFSGIVRDLSAFFVGGEVFVAHNARFDLMMLVFELRRLDKQWQFPFCPRILDTKSLYSGKLRDWGKEVKGEQHVQSHRALADVMLLLDCVRSPVRKMEE